MARRVRLIIDCSVISVGGGVQVALAVIEQIARDQDIEAVLVAGDSILAQCEEGVLSLLNAVHSINQNGPINKLLQAAKMKRIEADFKPDLVFTVFGPPYWRSGATNLTGFALGLMLYPEEKVNYLGPAGRVKASLIDAVKWRLIRGNCDHLVVETKEVRERLLVHLRDWESRIHVIPNGYSPRFGAALEQHRDDERRAADSNAFRTVFIPAAGYPHKNLKIVPPVARILRKAGVDDYRFVLTLPKGDVCWKAIVQDARLLGVEDMIQTVGVVANADIAHYYLRSDVVALLSFVESSTAVIPEAFAAGRPLIISDRPYAREACGLGAVYVDPNDEQAIADAILRLRDSSALVARLVADGSDSIEEAYSSPMAKWAMQRDLILRLATASK